MAKRDSQTQALPGMELPRESRIENAARRYRKAVGERLLMAKDEASKKKKVEELVLQWAVANNIPLTHWKSDKGKPVEGYVYRYGDLVARAERPEGWNVKVLLGEEVPDEETPAEDVEAEPEGTE